jgi:hypothetical protein
MSVMQSSYAQNTSQAEQIYKVSIEPIEQQLVKPLIGILMPVFNQVPFIEADNYSNFYYKFTGNLDTSQLERLLQNSKYVFLEVSIMDEKDYNRMLKQSLNPKN